MKLYVFTALLIVGKYTHLFRMSHLDLLANIHDCLFIYQACFKCVFDMPTRFLYITYEILHFMIWIYKIVIQLNFVKNLLLLAGHMFQVKFHRQHNLKLLGQKNIKKNARVSASWKIYIATKNVFISSI